MENRLGLGCISIVLCGFFLSFAAAANEEGNSSTSIILIIIGVAAAAVPWIIAGSRNRDKDQSYKVDREQAISNFIPSSNSVVAESLPSRNSQDAVFIYISGFGVFSGGKFPLCKYIITEEEVLFLAIAKESTHQLLGRIPLRNIISHGVRDQSKWVAKGDPGAVIVAGAVGLASKVPQRMGEFVLTINFVDETGYDREAVFMALTPVAFETLRMHLKVAHSDDERDRMPCPSCAELIKRDAKKCRFCGAALAVC
ncbi:MAG: hypothetical protein WBP29_05160 [Candidatus Zixiibacteriota bacterium]